MSFNQKNHIRCFFFIFFVFFSCNKETDDQGAVLARVKDKELTIKKLEKDLKPEQRKPNQIKNYINDWVNQTLLFEEGIKNNLHKDLFLIEMKNKYFKRLVSETFLETKTYLPNPPVKEDIKEFYEKNKASFYRTNDEVLAYHFSVSSMSEALVIEKTLKKKNSGSLLDSLFVKHDVSLKKIKKDRVPKKINDLVFKNNFTGVIKPFLFLKQYHTIEIIRRYKKGSLVGLEDVYDEIYQRLIKEQQFIRKTAVLDSLKKAYSVFINSEYN